MKKIHYILSISFFVAFLALIIIHEKKGNYFKLSVDEAHQLLVEQDHNINRDRIIKENNVLLLHVTVASEETKALTGNKLSLPYDQLLSPDNFKRLKQHQGIIAIESPDMQLASKAWLILTRKGIRNLKIIDAKNNEILPYTFEPILTN